MSSRKEELAQKRAEREEAEAAAASQQHRRRRLQMLAGAILIAAAIVVVIILVSSGGGSDNNGGGGGNASNVTGQKDTTALFAGIPQAGITLGNPKAPYTMVEFADLQCPVCGDYTKQILPTVVQKYVRTGKMKIELRLISILGPDSTKAQQYAAGVTPQNKVWNYADLFYRNQGRENSGYVTDEFLQSIAKGVPGLDVNKVNTAKNSPAAKALVTQTEQAAQTANVQGTPTFAVGKTGGTLTQIQLQSLDPAQFTAQLDQQVK